MSDDQLNLALRRGKPISKRAVKAATAHHLVAWHRRLSVLNAEYEVTNDVPPKYASESLFRVSIELIGRAQGKWSIR